MTIAVRVNPVKYCPDYKRNPPRNKMERMFLGQMNSRLIPLSGLDKNKILESDAKNKIFFGPLAFLAERRDLSKYEHAKNGTWKRKTTHERTKKPHSWPGQKLA